MANDIENINIHEQHIVTIPWIHGVLELSKKFCQANAARLATVSGLGIAGLACQEGAIDVGNAWKMGTIFSADFCLPKIQTYPTLPFFEKLFATTDELINQFNYKSPKL